MKRLTALFLTVAMLLLLPACAPDEPDTPDVPDIPSIGDESDSTSDVEHVGTEYDEIEYHRALGMTICGKYGIHDYYDKTTYEGMYQLVVDDVYRTKLNIEILRENGYKNPEDDALYALCVSFLEDKQPKCLHPQYDNLLKDRQPLTHIEADIYYLAKIDEARVAADEGLISFLAFWEVPRHTIYHHKDVIVRLKERYPLICEVIFGS